MKASASQLVPKTPPPAKKARKTTHIASENSRQLYSPPMLSDAISAAPFNVSFGNAGTIHQTIDEASENVSRPILSELTNFQEAR